MPVWFPSNSVIKILRLIRVINPFYPQTGAKCLPEYKSTGAIRVLLRVALGPPSQRPLFLLAAEKHLPSPPSGRGWLVSSTVMKAAMGPLVEAVVKCRDVIQKMRAQRLKVTKFLVVPYWRNILFSFLLWPLASDWASGGVWWRRPPSPVSAFRCHLWLSPTDFWLPKVMKILSGETGRAWWDILGPRWLSSLPHVFAWNPPSQG